MPDSNESDGSYDPLLGRFLSPDDIIPYATNLQAYNRYSYVINNPLAYTDPSGSVYEGSQPDHGAFGGEAPDDGTNNGGPATGSNQGGVNDFPVRQTCLVTRTLAPVCSLHRHPCRQQSHRRALRRHRQHHMEIRRRQLPLRPG